MTLFHTARGQGPTVLVLSAIGAAPYERMMPAAISDRFRLVFVELRGSGRSAGDVATVDFDTIAADLDGELLADRPILLGHSIAGMLAIEVARRRPGSVSRVIAVGTPPFGDMAKLAPRAQAHWAADASDERKQILMANLAKLGKDATPGDVMLAQTPARFHDARLDAAPLFAGAATPDLTRHILTKVAPGWVASAPGVPVQLALGRSDYTVPHVLWDGVTFDGLTKRLFERSGHQPFFEEPEAFADWMAG